MNQSGILTKNEIEANQFAAKVMLLTIIFIFVFFLMDLFGILSVPVGTMSLVLGISAAFLAIPAVIVFALKKQDPWVKYVITTSAILATFMVFAILTQNVILLYSYPVAIASLYFSRRLSWYTVSLSLVMLSIAQFISFYVGMADKNLDTITKMITLGIIPRAIEFLMVSAIFILLAKRTGNMLNNVMGAKEQAELLQKTLSMTQNAREVSNTLVGSVQQLSAIIDNTTRANEQIAGNTQKISSASESTIKYMDEAIDMVSRISQNINQIADDGKTIAGISQEVRARNEKSGDLLRQVIQEMDSIAKATLDSRNVVARLKEKSAEISRFVETITGISEQTNMLALNASIESARAGEQGRGFAVVAAEIRLLAEQSQKAASDIANLIEQITQDTEKAASAMDTNSELVKNGLSMIRDAGSTFGQLSQSGMQMHYKIAEVSQSTRNAATDSSKMVEIVEGVRDLNKKNLDELQEIAAAVEEQLASMQQVSSSVNCIDQISQDLLAVVEE